MSFKPDRDKLNANFDGYKLGKQSLPCISQSFEDGVRVARLKEEDFSYQHVRAYSLFNHLAVDSWDGRSVYWCTRSGAILRGTYAGSSVGVQVNCVYRCTTNLDHVLSSANPSLSFISANLCLFSTGCGSLYLLQTPSRGLASRENTGGEEKEETWLLLEELKLQEMKGEPFHLLSANYSEASRQLDVATMILHGATAISVRGKKPESKKPVSKPPIATYHWHRLSLTPIKSHAHPIDSQSSSANSGNKCSLVSEAELVCSLHSCTVALYCTFVSNKLVVLSEGDVMPSSQSSATTDESMETGEGEGELGSVAESVTQEPEEGDGDKSEKFTGLGFEGGKAGSTVPQYQWSQTESDVTITVVLPDDVIKHDIHCVIERREVVVGLTDGTTYFRGRLFAPINPECSTWTIDKHILEVSLEKQRGGMEWPNLREEEEEGSGKVAAGLPLQGPVSDQLSQQELEELRKKITKASKSEDGCPAAKKHHSMIQGTQYEECDLNEEEDATFFVITNTNDIPQKVSLAGHLFLFSSPSLPQTPPIFCLKHDVDAVLWQPLPPSHDTNLSWKHIGTFNALAYVQAARQDKKFTVCPPNMEFAALCDCNRHVFIYLQPEDGVKGNVAAQYVTTLQSAGDILGLQATTSGLVFVLKESELHVIVVSVKNSNL